MPAEKDRYAGHHVFTVDLPQEDYDALLALAEADSRKLRVYVRLLLMRHVAESRTKPIPMNPQNDLVSAT